MVRSLQRHARPLRETASRRRRGTGSRSGRNELRWGATRGQWSRSVIRHVGSSTALCPRGARRMAADHDRRPARPRDDPALRRGAATRRRRGSDQPSGPAPTRRGCGRGRELAAAARDDAYAAAAEMVARHSGTRRRAQHATGSRPMLATRPRVIRAPRPQASGYGGRMSELLTERAVACCDHANRPDVFTHSRACCALHAALKEAATPDVRAVVITGAARLMLGQDLKEFRMDRLDRDRLEQTYHRTSLVRGARSRDRRRQGPCAARAPLAAAGDIRIAADRRDVVPGSADRPRPDSGGSWSSRLLGLPRVRGMTEPQLTATEAHWGLCPSRRGDGSLPAPRLAVLTGWPRGMG